MFALPLRSLTSQGKSNVSNNVAQLAGRTLEARRYASDKAIRTRMGAVANIKKITRAMKMVASAKLRRCEDALKVSRAFSRGILEVWGPQDIRLASAVTTPSDSASAAQQAAAATASGASTAPANSVLVVTVTPDRGLCGSVSGTVSRATRNRLNTLASQNKAVQVITYGEKSRAALERGFGKNFAAVVTEHSKLKRRTFKQTCTIVDYLLKQNVELIEIYHNEFKNLISFETKVLTLTNADTATADPKIAEGYEIEGDADVLRNLYEFTMAVRLNTMLAESDMVEFSQRVNSMGNSSKSAEDVLSRLKLLYNRSRQARITTELVEIISGAVASEDQQKEM